MKNNKLTAKQKKILRIIYRSIESDGYAPTLEDLRNDMEVSSNQSILNHLEALEKKAMIKREGAKTRGIARGIKILPLGLKALGKEEMLPLVGTSSAGYGIESFTEVLEEWVNIPTMQEIPEKISKSKDKVFVIKVRGDSMVNADIKDGDYLLIKEANEYKSGDIVVARCDDGTTVKRFIAEGKRTYLKPENPAYRNIPIYDETIFLGKVVGKLNSLRKFD